MNQVWKCVSRALPGASSRSVQRKLASSRSVLPRAKPDSKLSRVHPV